MAKRKKGIMPKELVRKLAALLEESNELPKGDCPIYGGLCFYPISGPHLSCIFCRGRLARKRP